MTRVDSVILGVCLGVLGLFLALGLSAPALARYAYVAPVLAGVWFVMKAVFE